MRTIRLVTEEEIEQAAPGLLDALKADPEDVHYCLWCDGLRTHESDDCPLKDSGGIYEVS